MSPTARSAPPSVGLQPPVPVGVEQQPVLQVAAGDEVHRAERAAAARASRASWQLRVEADVEVDARARARSRSASASSSAVSARSSPAASRRRRACRPRAPRLRLRVVEMVRRGDVDDVDALVGEHRLEGLVRLGQPGGRAFARARSGEEPTTPVTSTPSRRSASTWTTPMKPVPTTAAPSCWKGVDESACGVSWGRRRRPAPGCPRRSSARARRRARAPAAG